MSKLSAASVFITIVTLAVASVSSFAQENPPFSARGGGGAGNGGTKPVLSYNAEDIREVPMNLSLETLNANRADIAARDRMLGPIFELYQKQNLSTIVNAIEQSFGSYVYVDGEQEAQSLSTKRSVMAAAVLYYTDRGGSKFDDASREDLPYRGVIGYGLETVHFPYDRPAMHFTLMNPNKKALQEFNNEQYQYTPFLLASLAVEHEVQAVSAFDWYVKKHAYLTTTQHPLIDGPALPNFLKALWDSHLKSLDATIVFLSAKLPGGRPYRVVYPENADYAPIPQPVIFVSYSASVDDLKDLLEEHAPQIYAYNQLLVKQQLPKIGDLNRALSKFPNVLPTTAKGSAEVDRENFRSALHEAFLKVSYSMIVAGMTPLALADMLLHPYYGALLIEQTNIIFNAH